MLPIPVHVLSTAGSVFFIFIFHFNKNLKFILSAVFINFYFKILMTRVYTGTNVYMYTRVACYMLPVAYLCYCSMLLSTIGILPSC